MTTAQALFDFTVQTNHAVEEALHFRARMGHRGYLEVAEPTVTFDDAGVCTVSRAPFVWHTSMPTKTTHGGKASFFDLTDESVIAAALKAKEGR